MNSNVSILDLDPFLLSLKKNFLEAFFDLLFQSFFRLIL